MRNLIALLNNLGALNDSDIFTTAINQQYTQWLNTEQITQTDEKFANFCSSYYQVNQSAKALTVFLKDAPDSPGLDVDQQDEEGNDAGKLYRSKQGS